jgi:hypothetical protein
VIPAPGALALLAIASSLRSSVGGRRRQR